MNRFRIRLASWVRFQTVVNDTVSGWLAREGLAPLVLTPVGGIARTRTGRQVPFVVEFPEEKPASLSECAAAGYYLCLSCQRATNLTEGAHPVCVRCGSHRVRWNPPIMRESFSCEFACDNQVRA